ncbi:MAG: hypothetical protein E7576_07230 [Ruminococcaceae bacterium]|nr:hypothetical protein [Oscillospiraceae bacterium]
MAKYYGAIGFADTVEKDPVNRPGVFEETVLERNYYGDVLSNNRRYEKGDGLNDNLNVRNEISILADPFAAENFVKMRYLTWLGSKWKITDAKVDFPRIVLTVGGVYNGPEE